MLWFLRLFPQFRNLETLAAMQAATVEECDRQRDHVRSVEADNQSLSEANQELIQEKTLLEDRLSAALQDKDRLWEAMQSALQQERYALHTMVNHAVQKSGGGIPFSEAHSLPPNEVRKIQEPGPIGRSGRRLPSQDAFNATREFVSQYMETLGPTGDKAAA